MTEIHVAPADDARRYLRTDLLTWFTEPLEESVEDALSLLAEGDRFAAQVADDPDADPTRYDGIYGVFPLLVTVPGPLGSLRQVPVAGLTWVSVHPDARRRGVLTAMLGDHLERTRAAGTSGLSALHASEPGIYGRHGYGIASWETRVTLSRGATLAAPGLEEAAAGIRTRIVDGDDPEVVQRLHALATRLTAARLGAVALPQRVYARFLHDVPQTLRDHEPMRVLFARRDGEDVGFAAFHRKPDWGEHTPRGKVVVWELDGDPATQLALVRRLVDMDLTAEVVVRGRAVDDPIVAWAGSPRGVQGAPSDSLWLRVVDLPLALTTRGYAAPCRVVLDVEDDRMPANHGRWLLEVGTDGVGHVSRTDAAADVALPTQQLAAAYLGDRSLLTALAAGLVTQLRPGAVAELDAAMRSAVGARGAIGF